MCLANGSTPPSILRRVIVCSCCSVFRWMCPPELRATIEFLLFRPHDFPNDPKKPKTSFPPPPRQLCDGDRRLDWSKEDGDGTVGLYSRPARRRTSCGLSSQRIKERRELGSHRCSERHEVEISELAVIRPCEVSCRGWAGVGGKAWEN